MNFHSVTEYLWAAISNYNGVVVSFQHHQSHWGQGCQTTLTALQQGEDNLAAPRILEQEAGRR